MTQFNPTDPELTVLNLNRQIDDLTESLRKSDRENSEMKFALAVLPDPPAGLGEVFTVTDKCTYIESRLAKMAKTLRDNSYGCHDCETRRFGPPAHKRDACAEHGEQKVCPACHKQQENDEMKRIGGLENA